MKSKNNSKQNNTKKTFPKRNFWQWFESVSLNRWLILAMIAVISIVYYNNYSSVYDKKVDLNGDNIYYYSLGQALSQGEGYTNIINLTKTPHSHFPPGYPYFISKIIKVFPDNIQTVKKANGFLLYFSVIQLFFIILITTKNSILSFCSSILMSMHRELLHFATIMMSEPLFIFLSMLSIFLALLIVKEIIGVKKKWVLVLTVILYGIVIAYTYLVRTMGLSLILALIAWTGILTIAAFIRWRKATKKQDSAQILVQKNQIIKAGLLCVITILAVGIAKFSWDARNSNLGIKGGDYEATFKKKINNEEMSGVEDWKVRIKSNTSNFVARWIPEATLAKDQVKSEDKITTKEWLFGILLLLVMLAGCIYMNKGRLLMLLYLSLTIGVLIFYPEQYGGLRYIIPIIPFFIFLSLNGISAIVALFYRLFKVSHPPLLVQSVILLLLTFVFITPRYSEAQTQIKQNAKMKSWFTTTDVNCKNFLEAVRFCGDSLPENARVINRKPELYYMFSNNHPSNGFPHYANPDTIYNILCRDSIDYLLIDNWFKHAFATLYPCVQKYPEKFKLVKKFGELDTVNNVNPTFVFYFNDFWGYHGEMKDSVREGQGVLNMQNGLSYKGSFARNLPNGEGTLYDSTGKVIASGKWRDGILYMNR